VKKKKKKPAEADYILSIGQLLGRYLSNLPTEAERMPVLLEQLGAKRLWLDQPQEYGWPPNRQRPSDQPFVAGTSHSPQRPEALAATRWSPQSQRRAGVWSTGANLLEETGPREVKAR
jgi:hypothetical protein